jgi:hypothetical protein
MRLLCQPLGQQRNTAGKTIGRNSVTKNRTLQFLNQPNPIKQRTAADVGMVSDLFGTKKSRALMLMLNLNSLTPQKKIAPLLVFKLNFNCPPRCC